MANYRLARFLSSALLIALASAILSVPVSASTPSFMLNNEKIRFGGGGHLSSGYTFTDSFANSGMPEQPFYKSSDGNWYKLTYSTIPLSMTLGSGTGGSNWSGATVPSSGLFGDSMGLTTLSNFAIDLNDAVYRSPTQAVNYGYGRVTVSGTVVLNGANLNVRHVYELGQNDSYVEATTTITNNDASTVNNVMIWIGTRDDWVGNSDSTLKERGNIINGEFSRIANRADASSAIRISTANEGILFYSTTPNTKTAIDSCCSFSNSYNLNPALSPFELSGDGSYAISLPVGNLAAGASTSITWFYAAGQIADLAEVVRSVASASAPTAPDVDSGNAFVTASWTAPASADPIVGYRIRHSTNNGTSWTTHGTDFDTAALSRNISSLTNGTQYVFQVAALTGDLGNSPTLGTWSASSQPAIPGGPSAPTLGTLIVGNSKLTVPFTAPSGNGGFPITDYEYSTNDGSSWTSSGSITSPIVISGLTNGTPYLVRLRAKSSFAGVNSSATSGTPQATAPAAPTLESIDALDAELRVTFTPPSDDGGRLVTNYKYSTDGITYRALSPSQTTSPITISKLSLDGSTSLANGTSFPVTLKAVNSTGDSAASNSISAVPKAAQSVTWQPEKLSFSDSELLRFTPFPLAYSDGPGSIVYSIADPGSSQCSIDASTGAISFSSSGVCRVRATASSTNTHKSGNLQFDFFLERVIASVAPTPTPVNTPFRSPRVVRPIQAPAPLPSPSPALVTVPNIPTAVSPESVVRLSEQLGIVFTQEGLPKLAPLESIGFVDGSPVPVSLFPNGANTGLEVEGDGFTILLSAYSENGQSPNLNSEGRLVLDAKSMAFFSGTGFAPNTKVVIWLFSEPQELGSIRTDRAGSFEGSLPLPLEISVGEHTVQLNGLTPDGEARSVSVGVVVANEASPLSSVLPVHFLAIVFIGGTTFFLLLLFKRRNREKSNTASHRKRNIGFQLGA